MFFCLWPITHHFLFSHFPSFTLVTLLKHKPEPSFNHNNKNNNDTNKNNNNNNNSYNNNNKMRPIRQLIPPPPQLATTTRSRYSDDGLGLRWDTTPKPPLQDLRPRSRLGHHIETPTVVFKEWVFWNSFMWVFWNPKSKPILTQSWSATLNQKILWWRIKKK